MKPAVFVCSIAMLGMAVTHAQQPAAADGWDVLSLEDYRALRARAFPSPPDLPSPPVDVALTRVDYDLRAAGSNATGLARLTIDVLKQGWITVPVPAGILVRHAQIDGQPTALVDDKPPRVVIARPGRTVLTLDVVVPIVSSAGSQTISLPAPGSAIAAISLAVPRGDVELAAGGATVVERSSTSSETRWVLYAPPEEPLVLTMKRIADDRRATLPKLLRAHVAPLVGLCED